ncbi:MAG: SurA N-terminal domain-containing protein [Candidatus Omnitrophota bacterium]
MLKQLRQKKTMKRILWAMAIIIIPAFVFWGAGSAVRSGKDAKYAGRIFGKNIPFDKYAASWHAVKNDALIKYGSDLQKYIGSMDLERQAWERLVLLAEAGKKKIKVNDREVVETIGGFPFFRSKGRFDQKTYELILTQVFKTDPREFEEQIRGSIMVSKLTESVIKGVSVSDEEVEKEYKKENERSKIAYILIRPEDFREGISVAQEEIRQYYGENSRDFRVPEQINARYLGFEFKDYEGGAAVSEEEIRSYYEKNKNEYAADKTLEELSDAIKSAILREKTRRLALEDAERIDYILLDKEKSLDEAAGENNIAVKETGFFKKQGPIPNIGWFPEIQTAAFNLAVGERTELIKSASDTAGGFYLVEVKEKKAPYVPELEEVTGAIEQILMAQKADALALEKGNAVQKEIRELIEKEGLAFEAAAEKTGYASALTDPFARAGYVPGIGAASELGEEPFLLPERKAVFLKKARAGVCIFTVDEVMPVSEVKFVKDKEAFTEKVLNAKRIEILNDWFLDLISRAQLKSNVSAPEKR